MKWLKIVSEIQKIDFINFTLYKISKKFDFIDIGPVWISCFKMCVLKSSVFKMYVLKTPF